MIELRNSKITYLGKTRDGRRRFGAVCYQGAAQMLDKGVWVDIKPRLVRDADGFHIEGAPYYAEIKDDGTRLFCPDKDDKSKYLRLPTIPLLSRLTKSPVFNPSKVGEELLPNQIVMPTPYGKIVVSFTCEGMKFEMLLSSIPPFNKLQVPVDSNLDIASLLKLSPTGEGIPRPRLVEGESERFLDWAYKAGELELYLPDDIKYPALFSNATYQTAANLDDIHEIESSGDTADVSFAIIMQSAIGAASRYWGFARWTAAIAQSSTIDSAYISMYFYADGVDNANFNIHFEAGASPATGTVGVGSFDITGRSRTTASTSWIENSIGGVSFVAGWYNSPSVVTPLQEVVDAFTTTTIASIVRPNQDTQKSAYVRPYNQAPGNLGPKLVVTWTEPVAGIGALSQQHNPWGINKSGGIIG